MDLMKAVECSLEGPIKTDLMKTAGSNIVLVCLETGQEIPPPSGAVFRGICCSSGKGDYYFRSG